MASKAKVLVGSAETGNAAMDEVIAGLKEDGVTGIKVTSEVNTVVVRLQRLTWIEVGYDGAGTTREVSQMFVNKVTVDGKDVEQEDYSDRNKEYVWSVNGASECGDGQFLDLRLLEC